MQKKKTPMRMCCGCGEMKPKKQLVRVVKTKEGEVSLDQTGKKAGRGAYLCADEACLKKARKTKRIDRAFECTIPDDVYDAMEEQLRGGK